jgi:hypothetical protein
MLISMSTESRGRLACAADADEGEREHRVCHLAESCIESRGRLLGEILSAQWAFAAGLVSFMPLRQEDRSRTTAVDNWQPVVKWCSSSSKSLQGFCLVVKGAWGLPGHVA